MPLLVTRKWGFFRVFQGRKGNVLRATVSDPPEVTSRKWFFCDCAVSHT